MNNKITGKRVANQGHFSVRQEQVVSRLNDAGIQATIGSKRTLRDGRYSGIVGNKRKKLTLHI